MEQIRIGTSGWVYKHWKNIFYPTGLAQIDWLKYYSEYFNTVELNSSFYHLPKESSFEKWFNETPDDFIFAVKGWGLITHRKRLKVTQEEINVFISRAEILGKKLGPILWQLPPTLKFDEKLFEAFFQLLPSKLNYALEVRHKSFISPHFYSLLKNYNIAICLADSPDFPMIDQKTAEFAYIRMHGSKSLYSSKYSRADLTRWALRINVEKAAYVYFNNDSKGFAISNAKALRELTKKCNKG